METAKSHLTDQASLKQLFEHNLNNLYYGKRYLNNNLAHLIDISSFKSLQLALQELQDDVQRQIVRLEEIYEIMGLTPSDADCIPVKAIFKETFVLERKGIGMELLGDMDIMLYMQLIEHINITALRMLRILAKPLKLTAIDQLLTESFDESVDDDQLFMLITNEYLSVHEEAEQD
jgi:ferritin-like metal-binding protein YciE